MIRWFLLAAALVFAAPAAAKPGVTVTVSRAEGGDWLVDYAFVVRSPVWFFTRSNMDLDGKPWRQQGWTVETPGVRLERAGHYDVLSAAVPLTRVRIRMHLFPHPLLADYTPVLAFSDGGLAFYSDHFNVAPLPTLDAVRALPADLGTANVAQPPVTLVFSDPGHRLLLRGKASRGRAVFALGDAGAYVYSGAAPVIETPAFAGVIDAGLPEWVRGELDGFTPNILDHYAQRLGKPVGGRPMALVAWQGADKPGSSMGGSVLDHMVVMQISGQQVLTRKPQVLDRMRWFIAHESAHFWLGQTVRYAHENEGWIMEGGADLLAVRGTQALIPDFDARTFLQREMDDCLKLVPANTPLAGAGERGENRAYYACGAMLMLAAEGAARQQDPKADIFDFVRALIEANRADGRVSAADWLAQFVKAGGDPAQAEEIRTLLDKGVADPRRFWMRLFTATGVPFSAEGEGLRLG
jgi:hypothetical protein